MCGPLRAHRDRRSDRRAVGARIVTISPPLRCERHALDAGRDATLAAVTIARQRLGRRAEDLVAARLQRAGWRLVERNYRTRRGEIDLICLDGRTLVFVEVKAGRKGAGAGPERPAFAVDRRKQLRLRRMAREWITERRGPSDVAGYRFDVVGVSFGPDGLADVDHLREAF
jgi:putative endonuclease